MRIGIPVWGSRISPVFDTARNLVVVDVAEGREVGRTEDDLTGVLPAQRAARLRSLGVEALLCGAISRPLAGMLASYGIAVVPWMSGSFEEVLSAYASGLLSVERYAMPGCCGRRRRFGRGRGASGRAFSPPLEG